jgi:hypothetical protein
MFWLVYNLAVPYGGRQDARLEPKYIQYIIYCRLPHHTTVGRRWGHSAPPTRSQPRLDRQTQSADSIGRLNSLKSNTNAQNMAATSPPFISHFDLPKVDLLTKSTANQAAYRLAQAINLVSYDTGCHFQFIVLHVVTVCCNSLDGRQPANLHTIY